MSAIARVMCWLIFGMAIVPALAQPAEEARKNMQGTWSAAKAKQDGKAADDVVGHRLTFAGNRFQIKAKDGKPQAA